MIVQLCFNSDRAPFSKVALALCALMMNYEVLDVLLNYNNLNAPFSKVAKRLPAQRNIVQLNYHNENALFSKFTLSLLALDDQ